MKIKHKDGYFPIEPLLAEDIKRKYYLEVTYEPFQVLSIHIDNQYLNDDMTNLWVDDYSKNLVQKFIDDGDWVVFE